MNARPKVITRSDPSKLVLEWTDGGRTEYTAAQLRGLCPCAACVHELTGKRMHDPASVPADMTHKDVQLVGNYALAIAFADGHDTGIFPFTFLRDNDPA
ncbi:MAG: DUF971 domain-containing protein [Planctomycetota bacterium]